MQARREGIVKNAEKVKGEDNPDDATDDYRAWRGKKIKAYFSETIDVHATDHSTIMTNAMHAEKALAYDVSVGVSNISLRDINKFRAAADWRFLEGLGESDPSKIFLEYFKRGNFHGKSAEEWVHEPGSEGRIPEKIVDRREHPVQRTQPDSSQD